MWIFRKNRGHISLETLSEYMDGRLSSGEREKVERHLGGCSECSAELESLRYTVSLLRRVPVTRPRSVYTLAEVPPLASTSWRARVPAWAYGAAASVFVALFALVLSADLTGSLAGDGPGFSIPGQEQDSPPVSQQSELMSDPEAEQPLALPPPTATPVLQPTAMMMMEATPVPQPTPVSEGAMEADPVGIPTPHAVAVSRTATPAPQPTATPAPMEAVAGVTPFPQATDVPITPTPMSQPASAPEAAEDTPPSTPTPQAAAVAREPAAMADAGPTPTDEQVAKEVASSVSTPASTVKPLPTLTARPTAPTVVESPTIARGVDRFQEAFTPVPMATAAPSPTPAQTPTIPPSEGQVSLAPESLAQAVPAQEVPQVEDEDGSTPLPWRVLEGVLAAAAVILMAGILWRLRHRRGRTLS